MFFINSDAENGRNMSENAVAEDPRIAEELSQLMQDEDAEDDGTGDLDGDYEGGESKLIVYVQMCIHVFHIAILISSGTICSSYYNIIPNLAGILIQVLL